MATTKETIDALEKQLLNTSGDIPLHNRFRALFTLKSLESEAAIAAIAKG
jgi:deoxyhypusine monooxygenase